MTDLDSEHSGEPDPPAPTDAEREAVAKAVYDHLSATRDHDSGTYPIYLEKTRYMMTVVMVVFASMSYALTYLAWAFEDGRGIHLALLCGIGLAGAVALLIAFGAGIMCNLVRDASVVGVEHLNKSLRDTKGKPLEKLKPEHIYFDLSINVSTAVIENRQADHRRAGRAVVLNWSTLVGFVLGAIFVAYTIAGHMVTGGGTSNSGNNTKETEMANEQPNKGNSQPVSQRPTVVEPTDTIKAGEPRIKINAGNSVAQRGPNNGGNSNKR